MDIRLLKSGSDYMINDTALDPAPELWMLEAPMLRQRGLVTSEVAAGRGQGQFCDVA